MAADDPQSRMTPREMLIFYGKLAVYLLLLAGVAYAVFLLTRSLGIHR